MVARSRARSAPPLSFTWDEVLTNRLRRHYLDERAPRRRLLRVVADLCGVHAQLMSSAEMTLWARVEGVTPDDVRSALWKRRTLVKTWAMRGTLHLLPAREFALWMSALGTYDYFRKDAWLRYVGLAAGDLERVIDAVAASLGGRVLTREELAAEIERRTSSSDLASRARGSWGSLLKPAAFAGKLCFAPGVGQKVRFTSPGTWIAVGDPVDADAALLEVTRRYLASNGPATRDDFARWWGTTPPRAGVLIARLGPEATEVDVEGVRSWMLAADAEAARGATPSGRARLVPAFDQYVVGAPRALRNLLPPALRDRIYRPQAWISPVLLVDGRMSGVWWHDKKAGRVEVRVEPFVKLKLPVRTAVAAEAEALAAFLGGSLHLTWAI